MSNVNAIRDDNFVPVALGVKSTNSAETYPLTINPVTGRLLTDNSGGGSGTVTDVSVVSANGFAGSVATSTTTPAITISTTITGILSGNGTAISAASTTGSGAVVLANTPTLITPVLGVATATSINKITLTAPATGSTLTIIDGKTLTINKTISFTAADDTGVYTLPTGTKTLVATDVATLSSLASIGTITTGTWSATTIALNKGGTGVTSISALSIWVANSANVLAEVTPGAGNSIRINGAGNAWEAFTPSAAVPTTITVANEATDTTCFLGFFTAATGDLAPKTNVNLAFNSSTGVLTLTAPVLGTPTSGTLTNCTGYTIANLSGAGTGVLTALGVNVGSAGAFVTFNGALGTPSSGTVTNLTGTASININGTVGATTPAAGTFTTAIANSFVPNSSTVPSNGIYLPAANTLGWAINSAAEMQLTATALSPAVDGGNSLGTTALGWQNLFGNTGFVFNIENGDWVATHTAGILTVGTGDLRVTTAGTNSASVVTVGGTQTLTSKTLTSPTLTTPSAFTTGGTITLAENTSIALDPAGSADGKYTGVTVTATAGYTQAFGDLVYLDPTDSRWEACDANSVAGADGDSRGIIGMVVSAGTDGTACTILLSGIIRADAKFPTFTVNNPIYVSETAGLVTQTQPTTTDVVIRIVGAALTADEMYFNPDFAWITHT